MNESEDVLTVRILREGRGESYELTLHLPDDRAQHAVCVALSGLQTWVDDGYAQAIVPTQGELPV